jgi:SPP1 family predicted phage head-tail adaptor
MNTGDLRHRIEIQSRSESVDSHGGAIFTWSTDTTVWASVLTLTGRKLELARQINGEATIEVRFRYCSTGGAPNITMQDRIKYGDRIFEPKYIVNENERDIMMRVVCKEQVDV